MIYIKKGYNCIVESCKNKTSYPNKKCTHCKNLGKLNPNYKKDAIYKQKFYCLDCNKQISYMAGYYGQGKCRRCANLGKKMSEDSKDRMKHNLRLKWTEPDFRNKMLKIRKSQWTEEARNNLLDTLKNRKMTQLEIDFLDFIHKHDLPFKYVGDGSFKISGFNPDFIDTLGRNKVIEVYYEYFKIKTHGSEDKYKKKRFAIFRKNNYETLFFSHADLVKMSDSDKVGAIKAFLEVTKIDTFQ